MRSLWAIIISFFMLFCMTGCVSTGTIRPVKAVKEISEKEALGSMSVRPTFHVNKRLVYLMAWNNIPVGKVIAESGDIIDYRGYKVRVMTVVTESNKFLSKIYRIEDTYTSYVDVRTVSSRRYEADRREGNYRKHLVVEYDFDKMEARYTNLTDGSVKTCPIEKSVQDPLSAIYYFMTKPVKPGEDVSMTINLNEKNYKLFGRVGKIEVIKLPLLGLFPAFKVRPYAELKGRRVKKGRAWMYFTADENRYPLYGVVLIPFGRVTATLRSVEDI
ncbi:MAG: DUF3108 domain-containing protein [Candidatus Omnitrophota bacterium]|nr:DUF3108 domain-containing protein [Candidatus Omnitrophota bacterium]